MAVTCAACGAENLPGDAFCDQCGSCLASACPSCGTDYRPEARFCRSCGTPLGAAARAVAASRPASASAGSAAPSAESPATRAERRLVSVLFADLVSFTSFAESRDPEVVRDTLTRYFDAVREVIERHGGRVEKFIGMPSWPPGVPEGQRGRR
jgi:hypothetical protein